MKMLTTFRFDLVPPKDPPPDPGKKAITDTAPKPVETAKAAAADTAKIAVPTKAAAGDPATAVAEPAKAPPAPPATEGTAKPADTAAAATVNPADTRDTTGFSAAPAPGADEKFSGNTLLVEAYAAIWLVMMAWLLMLWRKQASLTSRLDGLESALDRAEKRTAKPPVTKERAKEKEKVEEKAS